MSQTATDDSYSRRASGRVRRGAAAVERTLGGIFPTEPVKLVKTNGEAKDVTEVKGAVVVGMSFHVITLRPRDSYSHVISIT